MQAGPASAGEDDSAAHGWSLMGLKLLGLKFLDLKLLGIGRMVSSRSLLPPACGVHGSCVAIAKRSSVWAPAIFNIPETRDFPIGSKRRFCVRPRQQGSARVLFHICRRAFAARGDALDLI